MSAPAQSESGPVPVQPTPEDLTAKTQAESGGTKTVQAPEYVLKVTNPG